MLLRLIPGSSDMSLLLNARRKTQQVSGLNTSTDELRLEEPVPGTEEQSGGTSYNQDVEEAARSAGQNLFVAKSLLPPPKRSLPIPKLLLVLGGTLLLAAGGVGYLWYLDSTNTVERLRPIAPVRPITPVPVAQTQPIAQTRPADSAESAPQEDLVPGIRKQATEENIPKDETGASFTNAPAPAQPARVSETVLQDDSPIKIGQQKTVEQIDPLLMKAYAAYQRGELDQAQQRYLALFQKDARNIDVLLGLAAIAQQQDNNLISAQYYARVLELDPRNAAANAGMATLRADDENTESRLKYLLREQGDAAALHFALGNLYAGQSRWGEAQQTYFNAYTLEPGNAEFAFNLAVSLDHLGQGRLAVQHYQRALQLDPSHRAGFDHAQTELRARELTR